MAGTWSSYWITLPSIVQATTTATTDNNVPIITTSLSAAGAVALPPCFACCPPPAAPLHPHRGSSPSCGPCGRFPSGGHPSGGHKTTSVPRFRPALQHRCNTLATAVHWNLKPAYLAPYPAAVSSMPLGGLAAVYMLPIRRPANPPCYHCRSAVAPRPSTAAAICLR